MNSLFSSSLHQLYVDYNVYNRYSCARPAGTIASLTGVHMDDNDPKCMLTPWPNFFLILIKNNTIAILICNDVNIINLDQPWNKNLEH